MKMMKSQSKKGEGVTGMTISPADVGKSGAQMASNGTLSFKKAKMPQVHIEQLS
jgi:hypothetical protein